MNKCVAIAEHGRIELAIRKDDEGYDEFAKVLETISTNGCFSWYGDITNAEGKEQCGLVITSAK